jgi:L-amino acid N-acyltransferase YncA
MNKIILEPLLEKDLETVKEIYDFYILNSTATFHTEPISIDELKESLPFHHSKYKSFLIRFDKHICGFCYVNQYKKRQAYDRTAEVTIYIKPDYTGKGIGKFALHSLEDLAKTVELKVLIGIISGDNQASIGLFENCGYELCARFKQVGEKFGKIIDIVAFQKIIE